MQKKKIQAQTKSLAAIKIRTGLPLQGMTGQGTEEPIARLKRSVPGSGYTCEHTCNNSLSYTLRSYSDYCKFYHK